jgi:hypothetical protein
MNAPAINRPAFYKVAAVLGWAILGVLLWRDVTGQLRICENTPLTREQLYDKYGLEPRR